MSFLPSNNIFKFVCHIYIVYYISFLLLLSFVSFLSSYYLPSISLLPPYYLPYKSLKQMSGDDECYDEDDGGDKQLPRPEVALEEEGNE